MGDERIDYITETLRMRGMPCRSVQWEDTGGGCMCIVVRFFDGAEIALGDDGMDKAYPYALDVDAFGASFMDADGGSVNLGEGPFTSMVHEALSYAHEDGGIPRGVG